MPRQEEKHVGITDSSVSSEERLRNNPYTPDKLAPGVYPIKAPDGWYDAEEATEEPEPGDLDDLGYRDLQALAKEYDIPANQSADDLRAALEEAGV